MTDDPNSYEPNPYEPVLSSGRADTPEQSRRSPFVTALSLTFSLLAFALAAYIVLETIAIIGRQGLDADTTMGLCVAAVIAFFGAVWLTAAYFSWKRKRGRAIWIFSITLFVFLVQFLIMGV